MISLLHKVELNENGPPLPPPEPEQVSGLEVDVNSKRIILTWNKNKEPDIHHYNIYRGIDVNFDITPESPTGRSFESSYIDSDMLTYFGYYYKVAAVNNSGIIGPVSSEVGVVRRMADECYFNRISPLYCVLRIYPFRFRMLQNS